MRSVSCYNASLFKHLLLPQNLLLKFYNHITTESQNPQSPKLTTKASINRNIKNKNVSHNRRRLPFLQLQARPYGILRRLLHRRNNPRRAHPIIHSSETEYLDLLCTTCVRIAYLQDVSVRADKTGRDAAQIGALESGMVKAS
jgi:hypothetical protein